MKQILLSMRPFWKEKIMSGEKVYEYRSRFPEEEILAYLYVSTPVCGISGIIHLGKKIYLSDWKEKYKGNSATIKRIEEYESRKNKIAMPILSFQKTNVITRSELDEMLEKFIVPQSYYYLTKEMELTKLIESRIKCEGKIKYNDFTVESEEDICKEYR